MFQFIKLAKLVWFYFYYKIVHFQHEKMGKKVVLPPNKSKQGAFLFQAVIGYISSNHGSCYIKKTRAQVARTSNALLIAIFVKAIVVAIFAGNM